MGLGKEIRAVSNEGERFSKVRDRGPAGAAPPGATVDAPTRVVATGAAAPWRDDTPVVAVVRKAFQPDRKAFQPGGTPRPVSASVVVPMTKLHRLAPGATVPVKSSESNPNAVAVDWSTPA